MVLDEDLLAELKRTKEEIDRLQLHLKDIVAPLQQEGATTQESPLPSGADRAEVLPWCHRARGCCRRQR